jgi:hypothetical protein
MPRKVFVAGEILTAADVNTNLMDQAVMVFDDSAARGSAIPSPSEGMVTYLKDTDQLEKYTTDWVPAAPGKILQVVSTTKTDTFSTASGTFVDVTNLDVTITPSSTASKVLVSVFVGHSHSGSNNYIFTVRDGSNNIIYVPDSPGSRSASFFAGSENNPNSVKTATSSILLSPTTTSAVTYKVSTRVSAGTVYVNRSDVDSDSSNFGRTVSTITAMEVAG